jgi:hypothetical protein
VAARLERVRTRAKAIGWGYGDSVDDAVARLQRSKPENLVRPTASSVARVRAVPRFTDGQRRVMINVQTNDSLITVMLHPFAQDVANESVLFHDQLTTALSPAGATFRGATAADVSDVHDEQLKWHGVVEVEGTVAATDGILFYYNRPNSDIYMDVAEPFR